MSNINNFVLKQLLDVVDKGADDADRVEAAKLILNHGTPQKWYQQDINELATIFIRMTIALVPSIFVLYAIGVIAYLCAVVFTGMIR